VQFHADVSNEGEQRMRPTTPEYKKTFHSWSALIAEMRDSRDILYTVVMFIGFFSLTLRTIHENLEKMVKWKTLFKEIEEHTSVLIARPVVVSRGGPTTIVHLLRTA
jgi:hypothetical protein